MARGDGRPPADRKRPVREREPVRKKQLGKPGSVIRSPGDLVIAEHPVQARRELNRWKRPADLLRIEATADEEQNRRERQGVAHRKTLAVVGGAESRGWPNGAQSQWD